MAGGVIEHSSPFSELRCSFGPATHVGLEALFTVGGKKQMVFSQAHSVPK